MESTQRNINGKSNPDFSGAVPASNSSSLTNLAILKLPGNLAQSVRNVLAHYQENGNQSIPSIIRPACVSTTRKMLRTCGNISVNVELDGLQSIAVTLHSGIALKVALEFHKLNISKCWNRKTMVVQYANVHKMAVGSQSTMTTHVALEGLLAGSVFVAYCASVAMHLSDSLKRIGNFCLAAKAT
jgi:hypothetical protein